MGTFMLYLIVICLLVMVYVLFEIRSQLSRYMENFTKNNDVINQNIIEFVEHYRRDIMRLDSLVEKIEKNTSPPEKSIYDTSR